MADIAVADTAEESINLALSDSDKSSTQELKSPDAQDYCLLPSASKNEITKLSTIEVILSPPVVLEIHDVQIQKHGSEKQAAELSVEKSVLNCGDEHNARRKRKPKEKFFSCDQCGKKFSRPYNLHHHLDWHKGKLYTCELCGNVWGSMASLCRHMQNHSMSIPEKQEAKDRDRVHECRLCTKVFERPGELQRHLEQHKVKACEVAKMKLIKEKSRNNRDLWHLQLHNKDDSTRCHLCQKVFLLTRQHLVIHMRKYRGGSVEIKKIMSKAVAGEFPVEVGRREGHVEYICYQCGAIFHELEKVHDHLDWHKGKLYKCEMSKKVLASETSFYGHMKNYPELNLAKNASEKPRRQDREDAQAGGAQIKMENLKKIFKCHMCYRKLNCQKRFQFHLKWHSRDDSTKCQVCHKFFATRKGLVIHMRNHSGERPYKCEFCQRRFTASNYLLIHRRIHTGEKPYSCKECPLRFRQKVSYLFHMKKHTGNFFVCKHCGKKFVYPGSFKNHQNMHTGERPFVCNECGLSFIGHNGLTTHMKKHKDKDWVPKAYRKGESCGRPFECSLCGSSFVTQAHLEGHLMKHNGLTLELLKTFERCDACKRKFTSDQSFMHHIKKNHPEAQPLIDCLERRKSTHEETPEKSKMPEKTFICSFCGKGFPQKGNMERHERTHTGVKPYKCTECDKSFRQNGTLNLHRRIHTGEKPYKCTECDKTFRHSGGLSSHMRIHTGKKPYKCTECGKSFGHSCSRSVHMRSHTGEKPYICKVCARAFVQRAALNAHLMLHTNSKSHTKKKSRVPEKPFICHFCGKGFLQEVNKKTHERTHTGEKPYKCTECDKTFRQSGGLSSHVRIHTGEKPYVCKVCGRAFRQKGPLDAHLMLHTDCKPHTCKVCGNSFVTKYRLKAHELRHYPKNMQKKIIKSLKKRKTF